MKSPKEAGRDAARRGDRKLPGPFDHLQSGIERAAQKEGLWPLEDDHWKVIRFFLEYHAEHSRPPVVVRIGRATGFGAYRLHDLFPDGVIQTLCRITGHQLPADLWATHRRSAWN